MSVIVIHREKAEDAETAFKEILDILTDFKPHIKFIRRGNIELFNTLITVRCGEIYKMAGIWAHYYNTDRWYASEYLGLRGGKEFDKLEDLPKILAEIYSYSWEKEKE